jgi:3D-(3,5/4)-trihydroxycyclohexane-1,2-dione acylhydrolase (decyclizing)
VCGGGARYSGADVVGFAERHAMPIVETVAGRTLVPHGHPLHAGPLGIVGSASGNLLAAAADVVLAVGTRLQDFTTSSWTGFGPDVRIVTINAAAFDAVKRGAQAVVGDARASLAELSDLLGEWRAEAAWSERAARQRQAWDSHIDRLRGESGPLSYAQVVGVVNDASGPDDYVMGASGGIPGELHGGWRTGTGSAPTMDLEYGFSCMGYEVAGPWGASLARAVTHPDGLVTSLLGDGSYLMLNSELYSAAFAGSPFVAIVCDNGGYAVIHRLQTGQGAPGFNNLLADCAGPEARLDGLRVDLAAHARALGCHVEDVPTGSGVEDLRAAYLSARKAAVQLHRPAVVVCRTDPSAWTESGAWWEVGVPEGLSGRAGYDNGKASQLRWLMEPAG